MRTWVLKSFLFLELPVTVLRKGDVCSSQSSDKDQQPTPNLICAETDTHWRLKSSVKCLELWTSPNSWLKPGNFPLPNMQILDFKTHLFLSVSIGCNWANSVLKCSISCAAGCRTGFVDELLTEAISTTFTLKILNLQFKQLFFILEIAKGNFLMTEKKKKKKAWALWDEILPLFKRMANSMV